MRGNVEEVALECWAWRMDRALVFGDVDPHVEAWAHARRVPRAVVLEVRATAMLEGLGGRVEDE